MMKKVNLRKALEAAENQRQQNKILSLVNHWLTEENNAERNVLEALQGKVEKHDKLPVFPGINKQQLFGAEAIRKVAVTYRLRFLKSQYFAGEIPREALGKIRELRQRTNSEVNDFYILAPAKAFKLGDCNEDPLLFAQTADGRFYLIHQWGNDLSAKRKILNWPLRSLAHLATTVFLFSVLLSFFLPTSFFTGNADAGYFTSGRVVFFFWINLVTAAILSYAFFAFHIIFSAQNWNSKYFND
jgi:hypothetical protein